MVDKNFLHDTPRNLREKGDFKQVPLSVARLLPLIVGFTSNDGASFLGYMVNDSFGLNESEDNGVNPTLFKASLSKFVRARTSR